MLDHLMVTMAGEESSAPEYLMSWDYCTPLSLRMEIVCDQRECYESAGLGDDAVVGFSVLWHATGSGLRGASDVVTAIDGVNTVELQLPGHVLGGTLALQVVLTLRDGGTEPTSPLAAHRTGSLLWSTERRIRLEGQGSRFPISHLSFAQTGLVGGLEAAWTLIFESTDLYDSGLGNVRLYLNTDHPATDELLSQRSERSGVIEQVLHADMNRQLVMQALHSDELDISMEYPSDSMGQLLAMSVQRNFPGRTLGEVRSIARNSPGEFEGHLQARGGFLR